MGSNKDDGDQTTIPFVRGSETSEAAADEKAETQASDETRVLEWIRSRGSLGATDDEIEVALGMRHQNASARRNKLVQKGLVCNSGQTRETRSERQATIWILGTGVALIGAPNDKVRRPSREQLGEAIDDIHALVEHARQSSGPLASEALETVKRWLRWLTRH